VDVNPSPAQSGQNDQNSGGSAASGLDTAAVDRALRTWTTITAPARMLAIIDVSGSMKTPVPTAGNKTRLQVTVAAAQAGLALFDDSWALGLWEFSTNRDGTKPYKELMPIAPLSAQRARAQQVLGQLATGGDTGLFDTVLAAYKRMLDGYDPGRVNSIVLMTDGQNDNASGISSLNNLLSELKKLVDPKKPIRMIMIGIGDEVSQNELKAISNAAGASSGVYLAPDPAKIGEIFLQAIASR
jgi:Ca-activated chloride channel homolog